MHFIMTVVTLWSRSMGMNVWLGIQLWKAREKYMFVHAHRRYQQTCVSCQPWQARHCEKAGARQIWVHSELLVHVLVCTVCACSIAAISRPISWSFCLPPCSSPCPRYCLLLVRIIYLLTFPVVFHCPPFEIYFSFNWLHCVYLYGSKFCLASYQELFVHVRDTCTFLACAHALPCQLFVTGGHGHASYFWLVPQAFSTLPGLPTSSLLT